MVLRFHARPAHSLFSRFMFSFQGSVPSDFGFCFVAVSRRLVYNTMWPALCQHLFCYFFNIFSWYTRIRGKTTMLDYRLFRHQNFLKKVQKKLDFLPKNGKFCVKKSLPPEKFSRFFLSQQQISCLFFPGISHYYRRKRKNALCFRRAHEKLSVIFRKWSY